MNEAGLPEKWRLGFDKGGNRCVGHGAEKEMTSNNQQTRRLTIEDLSGSFVVFLIGFFSSVVVFIIELILRRRESATAVLPLSKTVVTDEVVVKEKSAANQPSTDNKLKGSVEPLNNDNPDNETNTVVVETSPIQANLKKLAVSVESSEEPK